MSAYEQLYKQRRLKNEHVLNSVYGLMDMCNRLGLNFWPTITDVYYYAVAHTNINKSKIK